MTVIEEIKNILDGMEQFDFCSDRPRGIEVTKQTVERLLTVIPVEMQSRIDRNLIENLVAKKLSKMHYDESYRSTTATLRAMESGEIADERVYFISAWEREADRAADGSDYAREILQKLLDQIATLLGETPLK